MKRFFLSLLLILHAAPSMAGSINNPSSASSLTGTLPVANGGTGQTTLNPLAVTTLQINGQSIGTNAVSWSGTSYGYNYAVFPGSAINYLQHFVSDNRADGAIGNTGAVVTLESDAYFDGAGSTTAGGHVVGAKATAIFNGNGSGTLDHAVGTEGAFVFNVGATGTVNNAQAFEAYFQGAPAGATITSYKAFSADATTNSGTMGTSYDFYSSVYSPALSATEYSLYVADTNKTLYNIAPSQLIGTVSIGTTTASGALNVSGTTTASNFTDSALTMGSVVVTGTAGILTQDNANLFYDTTAHRLMLGTSTPTGNNNSIFIQEALATSYSASAPYANSNFTINNTDTTANDAVGIYLKNATSGSSANCVISMLPTAAGSGSLVFNCRNAGTNADDMTIAADGGVTIGSPTGGDKGAGTLNATNLYIAGSAIVSSQWTTSGSNIYYSSGGISVGTSIAPNSNGVLSVGGYNIGTVTNAYKIGGNNALSFPTDSGASTSIAIGSGALNAQSALTATFNNTAVGYNTLGAAGLTTAATFNTAIGAYALEAITSGNSNTCIGRRACDTQTSGSGTTAVGFGASRYATTTGGNTAIGMSALGGSSLSGASNTVVGQNAGLTVSSGQGNTIVGNAVANGTLTTGSSNILIGVGTAGVAGGSDTPAAGTSNFLNIGNTVFATSMNTLASPTGLVGIGTATPSTVLDVNGLTTVRSGIISTGASSSISTDGVKIEYVSGTGYISSGGGDALSIGNGNSTSGVPANVWLTLSSTGSMTLANASAHAGQATCWTTSGQIGYCTTTVGAGGACTCTGL